MASSLMVAWKSVDPAAASRLLCELVVVRVTKRPDKTTLELVPAFKE